MSLPRHVYKTLEGIVGPQYVEKDPAIMDAYRTGAMHEMISVAVPLFRPAAVLLPGCTEEVQAIIKLANRYKFPFIPLGTHAIVSCIPNRPGTVLIDPKRMNRILGIDRKNMFAVVEPYVTHAQLHAETIKRGLYFDIPLSGGQGSVLANHVFAGQTGSGHRTGFNRNVLATEWVLPTGEILSTGSLGTPGAGYLWGEGPGPDLRGLMRGIIGFSGGGGMVTKMAVKLYPWPGPKEYPCKGSSPLFQVEFPAERFRFYMFQYPDRRSLIEALYEIGKAEIAFSVQKMPAVWFLLCGSTSNEEFWKEWNTGFFQREANNVICVWLVGFSSKRQLAYEEKVLMEIVSETGGKDVPEKLKEMVSRWQSEYFRGATLQRLDRLGTHIAFKGGMDSLDHELKLAEAGVEIKKPYVTRGDFLEDGEHDWICSYDMAHIGYAEVLALFSPLYPQINATALNFFMEQAVDDIKNKRYSQFDQLIDATHLTGPAWGNFHVLLKKVKKLLDPNNVSNPPYPITVEEDACNGS